MKPARTRRRLQLCQRLSWALGLGILFSALFLAAPVAAQGLVECRGIKQTSGRKVVLSRIEIAGNAEAERAEELADFLLFLIEAKLDGMIVVPSRPAATDATRVVLCRERHPNLDGSDFTPAVVDALNSEDVLLEMWGRLFERARNSTIHVTGWLAYVLIPVRFYDSSELPVHFRRVRYEFEAQDPENALLDRFRDSAHFDIHAAVALGVKALRNRDYDLARAAFCAAQLKLPAASAEDDDLAPLHSYIDHRLIETLSAARQDPAYGGALKLSPEVVDHGTTCPRA